MATERIQIRASGMMCSFCTMSVENALKKLPGVKSVLVNLVHGLVLIEADTSLTTKDTLTRAVDGLGYPVSSTEEQQYAKNQAFYQMVRWRGALGMGLSILDILVDPLNIFGIAQFPRTLFSLALAAFILIWVGKPVLTRTILAIRKRVINANVLLSTAAWGSFVIGALSLLDPKWPNFLPVASWLMSLHIFSNYFKLGTNLKAAEAVRSLLSLQPPRARVLRGDAEVEVNVKDVVKSEIISVRPGERIPLDGEVIEGLASVDESSFTGESVPVAKEPGREVIGGTLNLDGALRIKVTKVGEESFLSQLVKLMSQVADRKVPLELLADRLMNYYGPVVLILGVASFFGWFLYSQDPAIATVVFISTVIMGYPCALGITTPMLSAIAGGKGMSVGLLVKSGEVFHQLAHADTVVFDKTGTLTYGRPTVTDVVLFEADRTQVLKWAAAVESQSEHPLGRAIGFYAEKERITAPSVSDFRSTPGQGVYGKVEGANVSVGSPAFMKKQGIKWTDEIQSKLDSLSSEGKTTVAVAKDGKVEALVALQDTPRRGIQSLFEKLHTQGIRTVMLTGDSRPVAETIARELGINEVRAELLPAQKVEEIARLQKSGRKVAMVGDGINDGPALLQSDVGIAVGAGTDVAIESAGVILLGDRINDVANALTLGKASYRTMLVNVAVAVLFNIVGIILAMLGLITPVFAIVFMVVSIFGILINTLRIRGINLEKENVVMSEKLQQIEYYLPKMVCEGCAGTITDGLKRLNGIKKILPKVAQKRVLIQFEPSLVQEQQIVDKLKDMGHTAVDV